MQTQEHSQEWLCHERGFQSSLVGLKTGHYMEEAPKMPA